MIMAQSSTCVCIHMMIIRKYFHVLQINVRCDDVFSESKV